MLSNSGLRKRPQLSDEVAAHIRTRIMMGELKPGAFIRLDETAATLGVSVTPVREALLTLRGEGLVDLVPRRGYTVSPMTRRDIEDIFWLQDVILHRIIERAVEEFTDSDVEHLESIVDEFEAAVRSNDIESVVNGQYAIHRYINRTSHSDKLARFISNVARYLPYRLYAADPEWQEQALDVHRRGVEAFRKRDSAAVTEAMSAQFARSADLLIERLEQAGVWDDEGAGEPTPAEAAG